LDFQGDQIREGFKGRVPAGSGVGPGSSLKLKSA
jgi:hypothetical protein